VRGYCLTCVVLRRAELGGPGPEGDNAGAGEGLQEPRGGKKGLLLILRAEFAGGRDGCGALDTSEHPRGTPIILICAQHGYAVPHGYPTRSAVLRARSKPKSGHLV
jgi:hypothetical protein